MSGPRTAVQDEHDVSIRYSGTYEGKDDALDNFGELFQVCFGHPLFVAISS